jgi:hypothetical protein
MVNSFAALGKINGIEQSLYFGLAAADTLSPVWKFSADSIFYSNFGKELPSEIPARIYWLNESEKPDSLWLKFSEEWEGSADITLISVNDTIEIALPEELINARKSADFLIGLKLLSEGEILRIAAPNMRVAQKTDMEECGECLRAGVRESINVVFEMSDKDKNAIALKTVVFAQLVLPNQSASKESNELNLPLPVFVYNNGVLEDYRADSAFVFESDSLALQVTKSLRKNSLDFTLKLGNPILNDEIFSRPAYSRYDFNFEEAKLNLWFADYGDKK